MVAVGCPPSNVLRSTPAIREAHRTGAPRPHVRLGQELLLRIQDLVEGDVRDADEADEPADDLLLHLLDPRPVFFFLGRVAKPGLLLASVPIFSIGRSAPNSPLPTALSFKKRKRAEAGPTMSRTSFGYPNGFATILVLLQVF